MLLSFLSLAKTMKADPLASSFGKYDPSDTNLAFPFLRASAIAAQSSPGSLSLSRRIFGDSVEALKVV